MKNLILKTTDSPTFLILFLSALLLLSFTEGADESPNNESQELQEEIYASDDEQYLQNIPH